MAGFSRRDVLEALALLLGSAALPRLAAAGLSQPAGSSGAAAVVDGTAASAVGRRYLHLYPTEGDAGRLLSGLTARLRAVDPGLPPAPLDSASAARLRRALRSAVGRDFVEGSTVDLDGWQLAVTECRLCALIAIGAPQS